ncbi:uncharacterized protein TNCV_327811 [Trichonephila clavipes]|nr:uncharacterized protein TNCV_327811 [Trichonephila clavipes]
MAFSRQTLAARTLPPVTIRELRLALQHEWAAMPQQLIGTLILSMGRRWETCLAGLGSNPGEDMDVCNCKVPLRHGGTLNSRRGAGPLVWLVEGEERWEAPGHPRVFSL